LSNTAAAVPPLGALHVQWMGLEGEMSKTSMHANIPIVKTTVEITLSIQKTRLKIHSWIESPCSAIACSTNGAQIVYSCITANGFRNNVTAMKMAHGNLSRSIGDWK
jgi:hypothetical protein